MRRELGRAPRVVWWENQLRDGLRTVAPGDWQVCNVCGVAATRESYTTAQRKKGATMRLCRVCATMSAMSATDVAQAYEKIDPTTVYARWPLACDTMLAKLLIFQEERLRWVRAIGLRRIASPVVARSVEVSGVIGAVR